MQLNRRNWLKTTAMASSALALGLKGKSKLLVSSRTARPTMQFWEWETAKPAKIDMYNLRARLLANENPYGPSDATRLAIMDTAEIGNRYGHGYAAQLIEMIAKKEGVSTDHIMLSPGSSDLLEKTAVTLYMKDGGGNIVSADPAYMSIIKSAEALNAVWKPVPVTKEWAHDLPAMKAAVDSNTKLVYICNPNNPTATITPGKDLWNFCSDVSATVPVFVDEAYLEFMDKDKQMSMVGLINEGKNVIISRTFSKVYGMAGIRVGYIVAQPAFLEKMSSVYRGNMGMNITALKGAIAAMKDQQFIENSAKWNKESRDYVCAELSKMGYEYLPSHTSFVLFPIEMDGKAFLKEMFEKSVGVRSFEIFGQTYCRVSMGTMPEMKIFIDTLKDVIV